MTKCRYGPKEDGAEPTGLATASPGGRTCLAQTTSCEITGLTWTPDGRTMFVNVQHPGESPGDRSDPAEPRRYSSWPDHQPTGRPRSATVVVRKDDGGVIGS